MEKNLYLLAITLLLVASCNKDISFDNPIIETQDRNSKSNSFLENSGTMIPDSLQYLQDYLVNDLSFREDQIVFSNNEFILENDMIVSIDGLKKVIRFNKENNMDPSAHRETGEVFVLEPCSGRNCVQSSAKNIYSIAVKIASNVPTAWRQATLNAMNHWNNLSNNKIRFYLDNNPYCSRFSGIRVQTYSENAPNTIARAKLPSVGTPGEYVKINTNGNSYSSNDIAYFTRALIHEFGHTIGYRHTNQTNGTFINGSASVDPASVMNSFVDSDFVGMGFSVADVTAHNLKYPNASAPTKTFTFKCR